MAVIRLACGTECHVDEEDVEWLSKFAWSIHRTKSSGPYARGYVDGRIVTMHRLLMGEPDAHVDHEDGDGLNNRRSNLRLATRAQNAANMGLSKANRSGVKGVYRGNAGKWVAQIRVDGKPIVIGRFTDIDEAAAAYAAAARTHFGTYARSAKRADRDCKEKE